MMNKSILVLALAALAAPSIVSAQSSTGFVATTPLTSISSTGVANNNGGANGGVVSGNGGTSAPSATTISSTGGYEALPLAADVTGSNGQQLTFCQKYTKILYTDDNAANEQALMTAVISRAFLGNTTATNPAVPGIVAPNSPTLGFFTGQVQYKSNPLNYVDSYQQHGFNTSYAFGQLATKLVTYFGYGLGCTAPGFPGLAGTSNMTAVHTGMNINWQQMQYFDQQVALSMLSYGVSQQDIDSVAAPYLYQFNRYPSLHDGTVFPQGEYGSQQQSGYPITEDEICKDSSCPIAPPAYSFCEKYTAALYGTVNSTNEQALVTAVVARAVLGGNGNGVTVQGIATPTSPLLSYFNSSIQYRSNAPNYPLSYSQHQLDPNYDFGRLASQLVQYFGADLLGCRAPGYPQYTGASMQSVHQNMQIDINDYNYFVQQVGAAALSYGVSQQDVNYVATALQTNYRGNNANQICNQPSCPCQPGLTANADGSCSGTPTGPQPPTNNNGNKNNGNGAAMISPSMGGMIAAALTAVVALLL